MTAMAEKLDILDKSVSYPVRFHYGLVSYLEPLC